MKRIIAIAILLTSVSITLAQDFDLPEVLWYHVGMPRQGLFADEFTCVGDQNDDGYDDLLVNHRALNRVELFYGGEGMDNEPDFLFTTDVEEFIFIGQYMRFVGNILPDQAPFIAVSKLYIDRNNPPTIAYLRLFELGEEFDNNPEYNFGGGEEFHLVTPLQTHRSRPFDFNGDGYDEHVATKYEDGDVSLEIFFGGADFDTIPDWEVELVSSIANTRISTGYDINRDGYDDLIISTETNDNITHMMFLGGDGPDEEPIFSLPWDHFEGLEIKYGFALLPDVNGDGYDDWGVHFNNEPATWDGYYIFFGGDEPDMEPDVLLAGNAGGTGDRRGEICGGDFNNDGYGDIVTSDPTAGYGQGQLNYFFGRPELPDEMEADILINMERDFDEDYGSICGRLGAVGDYNGDNIEDFLSVNRGEYGRILILAGSDEWLVNSVDDDLPVDYELVLDAYPNPFNDTTTLSFEVPQSGLTRLSIYDINGQLQANLINETSRGGIYTTSWKAKNHSSGIYLAVLNHETNSGANTIVRKLIMLR